MCWRIQGVWSLALYTVRAVILAVVVMSVLEGGFDPTTNLFDSREIFQKRNTRKKKKELSAGGVAITGWRRLIGYLRLKISFCKRSINYRVLLRKIHYKDKESYGSSPPCNGIGFGACSTWTDMGWL